MKRGISISLVLALVLISDLSALPFEIIHLPGISEKSIQINSTYDPVNSLPLIITSEKLKNNQKKLALLISGDGGWYKFEQSIADNLSSLGIPTLGLDSRKYFWNRKSPEETADDIAKSLAYYCKTWEKDQIFLIGYSLGAEIVPFIYNRVPESIKSKIVFLVMLSPETNTDFEIHISNMLGMGNSQNTYNVISEIKRISSIPVLAIFGEGENSNVPELLKATTSKIKIIPGDHHYKFNVPLIINTMRENKAF